MRQKCKVCRSPYVEIYERLRLAGLSLPKIVRRVEKSYGEKVSTKTLSKHFRECSRLDLIRLLDTLPVGELSTEYRKALRLLKTLIDDIDGFHKLYKKALDGADPSDIKQMRDLGSIFGQLVKAREVLLNIMKGLERLGEKVIEPEIRLWRMVRWVLSILALLPREEVEGSLEEIKKTLES